MYGRKGLSLCSLHQQKQTKNLRNSIQSLKNWSRRRQSLPEEEKEKRLKEAEKNIHEKLPDKIYPSKSAMCRAYGVSQEVFKGRIKTGWTPEEAPCTGKKKLQVFSRPAEKEV